MRFGHRKDFALAVGRRRDFDGQVRVADDLAGDSLSSGVGGVGLIEGNVRCDLAGVIHSVLIK